MSCRVAAEQNVGSGFSRMIRRKADATFLCGFRELCVDRRGQRIRVILRDVPLQPARSPMCGKSSGLTLLLFLLAIPPAGAQTPSGELSGTVTDPSGLT